MPTRQFPVVLSLSCLLATCLPRLAPAQQGAPPAAAAVQKGVEKGVEAHADRVLARHLAARGAVGYSVGVARGGELALAKGYGRADLEWDAPAGPATMFRIGSVTKQFTAALVMRCVERGELSLDDALSRFVPTERFPTGEHVVTIRQLLNHTSGIPSYTSLGESWERTAPLELTHDELLAMVAGRAFDFAPGSDWRYSNTGYYLLGMVLEQVRGKPFAQLVADEIAAPLGLTRTRHDSNVELLRDRAQGYRRVDGAMANDEPLGCSQPGAAGALLSTGGDLVRWSMALVGGRVVSAESFEQMRTAAALPDGRDTGYGFGLMLGEMAGRRAVQHGGGINGFQSILVWLPDDDLHVAVIANSEHGGPRRVAMDLVRALLGIEIDVRDEPVTAEHAARIAGEYHFAELGMNTMVGLDDGRLMVQGQGQRAFRILWQGGDEFRAEFDPEVRLVFAADGQSFVLHQGGGTFTARRLVEAGGGR